MLSIPGTVFAQYYPSIGTYQNPQASSHAKPQANHNNNHDNTGSNEECSQYDPKADQAVIAKFKSEVQAIESLKSSPEVYENQLSKIAQKYVDQISTGGLQSLLANLYKVQLNALTENIETDQRLAIGLKVFEENLKRHELEIQKYSKSGFSGSMFGESHEKLRESGDNLAQATRNLQKRIEKSKLPPEVKENILLSVRQNASTSYANASLANSRASDRYDRVGAGLILTRDVSAGAALVLGGVITGGSTTAVGASVLGATGSKAAVIVAGSITMGAAGAAGGAGYGLVRGNVAQAGNALLSDENFLCALAREQGTTSGKIYKDALVFAAMGGLAGAGFGAGLAFGGAVATTTLAAGTGLGVLGGGATLWNGSKEAMASYELYEKAHKAAEAGNEAEARQFLNEARSKAVEAGLSGVDTIFAAVGSKQGFNAFRDSLKKAPASLDVLAKEHLATKNNLKESFNPKESSDTAEIIVFDAHNRPINPEKVKAQYTSDLAEGGNTAIASDIHFDPKNPESVRTLESTLEVIAQNQKSIKQVVAGGDFVDQGSGTTAERVQMTIDLHRRFAKAVGTDEQGNPKPLIATLGNHDDFRLQEVRLPSGEIVEIPRGKLSADMPEAQRKKINEAADWYYQSNGFEPSAMRTTNKSGDVVFSDPVAKRDVIRGLNDLNKEGLNVQVKGVDAGDMIDLGDGAVLSHYALANGGNVSQAISHTPKKGIELPAGIRTYIAGDQHSAYSIIGGKNWIDGKPLNFYGLGSITRNAQTGNTPSIMLLSNKGRGYFVGVSDDKKGQLLTNFTQVKHSTQRRPDANP